MHFAMHKFFIKRKKTVNTYQSLIYDIYAEVLEGKNF